MTDDCYRIAMAYQACEVADRAREAVTTRDPDQAVAQALAVLNAAHDLLDAAVAFTRKPQARQGFALTYPDEAAEDIADWLATWPGSTDHAHGAGRGPSPSTHS
jgi:hypothetical protein